MPRRSNLAKRIISLLEQRPTASRKEIKIELGVSYQSVQKQLKKLQDDKYVLPGFVVMPVWTRTRRKFWVFIDTQYPREDRSQAEGYDYQRALCDKIRRKLTEDTGVANDITLGEVNILLGSDWDILLALYAQDAAPVEKFITTFVRSCPEVAKTSTAWGLSHSALEGK